MLNEEHFQDLRVKGYTVVNDVISTEECDEVIGQYRDWLKQFGDGFPNTYNSLVEQYNSGHLEPTWRVRLKTKSVFAQIWKTEKLLTSFDAISIGRPPEDGEEGFQDTEQYWLHSDQLWKRLGLHAYQGALYLEEQCEDDWTFQVMEGSHNFLHTFYEKNRDAATSSMKGYYNLSEEDINYFQDTGCRTLRIPVPKGGMALWDSRLIHANARPLKNREHPGRWRFTVFASMTPAIWASTEDHALHRKAYTNAWMTTHWSSQGVKTQQTTWPRTIKCPTEVPDIAKTDEAKLLSGVLQYEFNDRQPNGDDHIPQWVVEDDDDAYFMSK